MKHIIIGGDGFVGQRLAQDLTALGQEVKDPDVRAAFAAMLFDACIHILPCAVSELQPVTARKGAVPKLWDAPGLYPHQNRFSLDLDTGHEMVLPAFQLDEGEGDRDMKPAL